MRKYDSQNTKTSCPNRIQILKRSREPSVRQGELAGCRRIRLPLRLVCNPPTTPMCPSIAHGALPKANDKARFPIFIPPYLKYTDLFAFYTMPWNKRKGASAFRETDWQDSGIVATFGHLLHCLDLEFFGVASPHISALSGLRSCNTVRCLQYGGLATLLSGSLLADECG